MRAVIQRVIRCGVLVDGKLVSEINNGVLVLLGIEHEDDKEDADWLCRKITSMRIFDDANGVMNLSVVDQHYEILVVSQFTLYASTKKGNRPSYIRSAPPELAEPLYEHFVGLLKVAGVGVKTGIFGADMQIELVNSGPVTILMDSKARD